MAIGLVRKWTDVGAPKLWANTYGSFPNLLKAVLVDGYGSLPSLGWTHEYVSGDTYTRAFRNSQDGTGTFLKVNSSNDGKDSNLVTITSYESMGSIDDNNLTMCPPAGNQHYLPIGNTNGTTHPDGIHWIFIGDNLGFWFLWRPYLSANSNLTGDGKMWFVTYIGDYIKADISFIKNWFQSARVDTSTTTGMFGDVPEKDITTSRYITMRNSLMNCGPSGWASLSSGSQFEELGIGESYQLSPINNVVHFSVPFIYDMIQGVPVMLGWLPGLLNPLIKYGHNGNASNALEDSEITLADASRTLHLFKYRVGTEAYDLLRTIGIISGEGFRNVL